MQPHQVNNQVNVRSYSIDDKSDSLDDLAGHEIYFPDCIVFYVTKITMQIMV